MHTKTRNVLLSLLAALWLALAVWSWLRPSDERSDAERRRLQQLPALSAQTLSSGSFMSDFERYTQDQFPLRDDFRTVKAAFSLYALRQMDNNGIYIADGSAAKRIYPLDEVQLTHAADRLSAVYEQYFAGTDARVFFAVVPDKGHYLAGESGHLTLDFAALSALVEEKTPWAEHIDLSGALCADSYYRTDTHWRQEAIAPVADLLADALGIQLTDELTPVTADTPFYGVYYGQSALPLSPDEIVYLTSDTIAGCTVYNYETGQQTAVYDLEKLRGEDPYDVFLSGAAPLLRVDNPAQENGRTLVLLRDSFGSSLAPLLLEGYSTVYLVDTRYISPSLIGKFVEFPDACDVLFLYSTLLLNESGALK